MLVSEALTAKGIDKELLGKVQAREFWRSQVPEIYQPPLMVIEERDRLYSGLWESGFLAYTNEFVGIKVQSDEEAELKYFHSWFTSNNDILRSCLHLCGGRMLVARATATQKKDIMNLPYPDNGNFDLVPWEKELLEDIRDYMADYVRIGQNSELLKNKTSEEDLQHYSQTFLRLMNKTYPNLKKCKERQNNDFRLIAFSFAGDDNSLSELDDSNWLETLSSLIGEKKNNILRTQRIIKQLNPDLPKFLTVNAHNIELDENDLCWNKYEHINTIEYDEKSRKYHGKSLHPRKTEPDITIHHLWVNMIVP